MNYCKTEYRVVLFGRRGAEKWTRHAYNIPAHVGLGWTPYRVLVRTADCRAHSAFLTFAEFRRWMRAHRLVLRLLPHRRGASQVWVMRSGSLWR